jgi:hypothetical protein
MSNFCPLVSSTTRSGREVSIPGKVYFESPSALAKGPTMSSQSSPTHRGIDFINSMHEMSPPSPNADDPHQNSIDGINAISSLNSNAEEIPMKKLSFQCDSLGESSQMSSGEISTRKVVRFKEPNPTNSQSKTETITKDVDLDGNKMSRRFKCEYPIQKDARAEFISKFESNWQSTRIPKHPNQISLHNSPFKKDHLMKLKFPEIPEDSHSSRFNTPVELAPNNIMSKKRE